jgi:hypothetical protein
MSTQRRTTTWAQCQRSMSISFKATVKCSRTVRVSLKRAVSFKSTPFKRIANFAVNQQNMLLGELVTCSANLHSKLQGVFGRLDRVENENAYFRSVLSPHIDSAAYGQHPAPAVRPSTAYRGDRNGRSRSPSPTPHGYREREDRLGDEGAVQDSTANSGKKGKGRKALKIAIPGKSFGTTPGIGLPTPSTRTAVSLLHVTPGPTFDS